MEHSPLLTPREVAEVFGVRATTVARWAKEGRLETTLTPGGHRRYPIATVRKFLQSRNQPMDPEQEQIEIDATRLYEQGWSIREVAEKFNYNYSTMRRVLLKRTTVRGR